MGSTLYCHRKSSDIIVLVIKGCSTFEIEAHRGLLEKNQTNKGTEIQFNDTFNQVLSALDNHHLRAIHCTRDEKISPWLTATPLAKYSFESSAQEFVMP